MVALDGQHTNMIDIVLMEKRRKTAIGNCRTYHGANIIIIRPQSSNVHDIIEVKLKIDKRGKREERKRDIQALSGGDLAPSLEGTQTFFRGPRFLNDVFSEKKFNFHGLNF